MSDVPLDLKEQLARIDRMIQETGKFAEETRKFTEEQHKLIAEERKLGAEAAKLERDRWLAPWMVVVGGVGGMLAIAQFLLRLAGKG